MWFRDLLTRLEVDDPDGVATQLALLLDGAIAAVLVRGDAAMARSARDAARTLLEAAGVRVSSAAAGRPRRATGRRGRRHAPRPGR